MTDLNFILWIQQFSNEILDKFFVIITMMGNPEYYMIIIPLLYWCFDKRKAFRFTMFFLISSYANSLVKESVGRSRPPADKVRILYGESTGGSASFPSGHAQGTASLWFYAASYFKKRWVTILSILVILLVSLSRIYLGLHYPTDIIAGIVLAGIILLIYNLLYEPICKILVVLPFGIRIILTFLLIPLILWLPSHDKGMVLGLALGFLIGYQLQERYLNFNEKSSAINQVIKFIIGLAGLFGFKEGLKIVFANISTVEMAVILEDTIRYAVVGLWATYIGPWVFIKLGLSRKDRGWNYRLK